MNELAELHPSQRCPARWKCEVPYGYRTTEERDADIAAHYVIYSGTADELRAAGIRVAGDAGLDVERLARATAAASGFATAKGIPAGDYHREWATKVARADARLANRMDNGKSMVGEVRLRESALRAALRLYRAGHDDECGCEGCDAYDNATSEYPDDWAAVAATDPIR